jgi:hypothetical protein
VREFIASGWEAHDFTALLDDDAQEDGAPAPVQGATRK